MVGITVVARELSVFRFQLLSEPLTSYELHWNSISWNTLAVRFIACLKKRKKICVNCNTEYLCGSAGPSFFFFLSSFLPAFLSGFLPPFRCFFTSLRWIWLLNGVLYWLHLFDIWPCCHKQGNPRLWVLLVSPLSLALFISASASVCLSLLHLWVLHRLVTWPLILQRRICAHG